MDKTTRTTSFFAAAKLPVTFSISCLELSICSVPCRANYPVIMSLGMAQAVQDHDRTNLASPEAAPGSGDGMVIVVHEARAPLLSGPPAFTTMIDPDNVARIQRLRSLIYSFRFSLTKAGLLFSSPLQEYAILGRGAP
jgi:hypothetical protein